MDASVLEALQGPESVGSEVSEDSGDSEDSEDLVDLEGSADGLLED